MRRHTYSTDNDYRPKTVAVLAILAYVSGSWISSGLTSVASLMGNLGGLGDGFLSVVVWLSSPLTNLGLQPEAWVPTTGALFAIFFWAFSEHLWHWDVIQRTPLVNTPDLQGRWTVYVLQTKSDGDEPDGHRTVRDQESPENVIEKVSGQAYIEQSWRKIQISMEFDYSTSVSLGASFVTDTAKPRLNYYYRNEPNPQSDNSAQVHYGMVDLRVEEGGEVLEGEYFTDRFRNTSGRIILRRANEQGEEMKGTQRT